MDRSDVAKGDVAKGDVAKDAVGPLELVRRSCLALPEVGERPSHGAPTFFVQGKSAFVMVWIDGHHGNTFPHMWCAAGPGVQGALIASRPGAFFRPPYVGHRGWIGVRLDAHLDPGEIAELCEEAFREVAPQRLVDRLGAAGEASSRV